MTKVEPIANSPISNSEGAPIILSNKEILEATDRCYKGWETGDVEACLATYTDDVVYSDMKCHGRIVGKIGLRKYLTRFFNTYDIKFRIVEEHRLQDMNGLATIWEAAIRTRKKDGSISEHMVLTKGFDIVMVRGDQVSRDEAYWDYNVLDKLNAAAFGKSK